MKILYVTTVGGTMSFFIDHFKMLIREGHTIELACNTSSPINKHILDLGVKVHNVPFSRSPISRENAKAYKTLKTIIMNNSYDIVHCHTPNAAVITRFVCNKYRKKGLKVFYTAHGFHFFKGAPLKNWLFFFPIEWICSFFTDSLITINKEDYALAKKHMHANQIEYIPGVGIDVGKFVNCNINRNEKRKSIGLCDSDIMVLSVGELNSNKNQSSIIKAIAKINDDKIHYVLAGSGDKKEQLMQLSKQLNIEKNVHFIGFRDDINELCCIADIFAFPSYREGLGLAAIEAMASGLPLITSNMHGINDYSQNNITGFKFDPNDVDGFADGIEKLAGNLELRKKIGENNVQLSKKYDSKNILILVKRIFETIDLS